MTITPAQSRAARGLLEWSQTELATRAGLSESTIRDFEKGRRTPSESNLDAIEQCLVSGGILFVPDEGREGGPGVRFSFDVRSAKIARVERHLAAYVTLERGLEKLLLDDDEEDAGIKSILDEAYRARCKTEELLSKLKKE